MTTLILFNKPYQVLCQFQDPSGRATLKDYIPYKDVYAAGRLDYDSEGLLLLTDDGKLQHQIAHPRNKLPKTYWVQVEGDPTDAQLEPLRRKIILSNHTYQGAIVRKMSAPAKLWPRVPPIRERKTIPTSWLEMTIQEGKNRQVRRMTAFIGFPTLRLIRASIGQWDLQDLQPGHYKVISN